ncbi:FAD/NAD(P)-binding protein [Kibdelosporangium phytohabitans]|uniref:FAD-binding protein n=1 Tax=Kibdelosporangium phytohabitans TaxID=860235 RepID=A0A0N9I690_9PSEU|nr:FAD/NAD(P)-binding protein [Kibdelosporangium phytohabitans]ALG09956.1 FAD-binding protein [Kibdelosporangium phytohabitans]MBE1468631.1 hypothetical protein [Kibdelosporangium phytohabitans]
MTDATVRVCVVGLGPRGLSVLERMCANAAACVAPGHDLVIHVVDPRVGHGGEVWRDSQDPELLMNTVTSQISMFVDDSVTCAGPVVSGPSLHEWARFLTVMEPPGRVPDLVREEAARLGPDSYPSRSFYGHYLNWTLRRVLRTAPVNVKIELHTDSATDLREAPGGSQSLRLTNGGMIEHLDAVVLAQGHLPARPGRAEAALGRFADAHGLRYVPPGNPADVVLDDIGPGEVVILRGLGLNFFDHMALLTVGRGGRFSRRGDGSLTYQCSGREPRLVAGSRRGIPYQARGENQKGPSGRHHPIFLTEDVIAQLRSHAARGEPVNFRRDVWPLIDLEVRAVYYGTMVRERNCVCDATSFLQYFTATMWEERQTGEEIPATDPFAGVTSAAEDRLLSSAGIADDERWDWRRINRPYGGVDLPTTARFRGWLRSYLDNDVLEARLGNVHGALKAALDVLRDLRNEIRLVVDHGRLSGDSYRDDLQRWYMPLNAFVSIGPPAQRVEELVALIDAGVVAIMGPGLVVDQDVAAHRFVASSRMLPDLRESATTLIEARLPETDLRHTIDPLVRNLLARGESRLHRIPILGGGSYPTGGLAVTQRPYHLIDADGSPHPRRFAFGVPTETVHWITAAGIRPGVDSVILSDADAVARASLTAAAAR